MNPRTRQEQWARHGPFCIGVAILLIALGSAHAQNAIRMLSGHPPGGAVDALARTFADRLSEATRWGLIVKASGFSADTQ
jgi:tripartite-type tricarboxylate transporter receptor subunit TctC